MLRRIIHIVLAIQVMLLPIAGISAVIPEGTDCCSSTNQQQLVQDDHTGCTADACDDHGATSQKHTTADESIHFCHCCTSAIPSAAHSGLTLFVLPAPLHIEWTAPTAMLHLAPIDHPPC